MTTEAEVRKAVIDAVIWAEQQGYVVEVTRHAFYPLAMGHHGPHVKVWAKRTALPTDNPIVKEAMDILDQAYSDQPPAAQSRPSWPWGA